MTALEASTTETSCVVWSPGERKRRRREWLQKLMEETYQMVRISEQLRVYAEWKDFVQVRRICAFFYPFAYFSPCLLHSLAISDLCSVIYIPWSVHLFQSFYFWSLNFWSFYILILLRFDPITFWSFYFLILLLSDPCTVIYTCTFLELSNPYTFWFLHFLLSHCRHTFLDLCTLFKSLHFHQPLHILILALSSWDVRSFLDLSRFKHSHLTSQFLLLCFRR